MKQINLHPFLAFIRKNWFYILAIPFIIYFSIGIYNRKPIEQKPNPIPLEQINNLQNQSKAKQEISQKAADSLLKSEKTNNKNRTTLKNRKYEAIKSIQPLGYDSIYKRVIWAADATNAEIRAAYSNTKTTD